MPVSLSMESAMSIRQLAQTHGSSEAMQLSCSPVQGKYHQVLNKHNAITFGTLRKVSVGEMTRQNTGFVEYGYRINT